MRYLILAAFITTPTLAHEGVKDPQVMARMQVMMQIGAETKTLGQMAKGETAFDAGAAQAAMGKLRDHAAETPALFEAPATDPKSEALPAIWEDFADFTQKSQALEVAATATITTPEDLQAALQEIGATCRSCHRAYRE